MSKFRQYYMRHIMASDPTQDDPYHVRSMMQIYNLSKDQAKKLKMVMDQLQDTVLTDEEMFEYQKTNKIRGKSIDEILEKIKAHNNTV